MAKVIKNLGAALANSLPWQLATMAACQPPHAKRTRPDAPSCKNGSNTPPVYDAAACPLGNAVTCIEEQRGQNITDEEVALGSSSATAFKGSSATADRSGAAASLFGMRSDARGMGSLEVGENGRMTLAPLRFTGD
eukprot:2651248-Rhodomonas_salina.3